MFNVIVFSVPYEPVGDLKASPVNSTLVRATWKPVPILKMNSPFLTYKVSCAGFLRNGTYTEYRKVVDGLTTSAVFGGLFPFTEYIIAVAACNDAGCNKTSTVVLTNQTG